jgi:hypothetical protein
LLVILASPMWAACEGRGRSVEPASSRPATSVTRGDEITLRGRVTAAFSAHVFAVGSGAERVIVVTDAPTPASLGREIEATGRVSTFRPQELEAELGVDLDPATDALEDITCLLASMAQVL